MFDLKVLVVNRCLVEESDLNRADRSARLTDKQFDPVTFSVLKVAADEIAAQLTIGDLPIFKAIKPEELTSCSWNSKNKLIVAPNVVAFIRRFNHVCLWCQKEILSRHNTKLRAEVLAHYIKIAKKLIDLNNIHSSFAIISGLQSNAVYRLTKTWGALVSKDRSNFDKMAKMFSDSNNWERLRKYMDNVKLPIIPYLGLYLTDLVYINVAHPCSGGLESSQRQTMMNNILRVLADYQSSEYESLVSIAYIQDYLKTIRYIDELQKFLEEDLYNLSLQLEPNENEATDRTAVDSCMPVFQTGLVMNEKAQLRNAGGVHNETFPFIVDARRHLLDDSLLEFSSCTASSASSSIPQAAMIFVSSDYTGDSGNESVEEASKHFQKASTSSSREMLARSMSDPSKYCLIEGPCRKKTVLKLGHRPRYKNGPSKIIALSGWMVVIGDDPFQPDSFILQELVGGTAVPALIVN
ncbi:unnamed protein product [Soboliphyme baturini]|uniref:Ras-GEF domain-containing protein n=1 Tax=Soboliphyme baturini TaxID=241478 RepID=A0A183IFD4_9BILA|nr:unnamed protein product [Soboliphyme baturini]